MIRARPRSVFERLANGLLAGMVVAAALGSGTLVVLGLESGPYPSCTVTCGYDEVYYGCGGGGGGGSDTCSRGRAELIAEPVAEEPPEPDYGPIVVRAAEGGPQ